MTEQVGFNLKKWVLFNFFGWFLGVTLILGISQMLDFFGIKHQQLAIGMGMGLGIGLVQWFLLRTSIPLKFSWVLVSVFGMTLPFVVLEQIGGLTGIQILFSAVSIGAVVIGYVHYALLKHHVSKAILWLPASAIGWMAALAAVKALDYTYLLSASNMVLFFVNLGLILSGGLLLGLSSGIVLKRILSKVA